jgi:uncharacterized protein YndB with AHSA1/START domain
MPKSPSRADKAAGEITITREFSVPRALVWKAWTDPDLLKRWHGPKGFTAPFIKNDLREGGRYHYCMRSPEGQDHWSTGTFLELVEPERMVCTDSFADPAGNVVPASFYGMVGDMPLELRFELDLKESRGRTRLTLRHFGIPVGDDRDLAVQGWNESLGKLEAVLMEMKALAAV